MRIDECKPSQFSTDEEKQHEGKFAVAIGNYHGPDAYLTLEELIELRAEIDKVLLRKALGMWT